MAAAELSGFPKIRRVALALVKSMATLTTADRAICKWLIGTIPQFLIKRTPKTCRFHGVVPVEIKRVHFDLRALDQLQRYMRIYGCECGISVAPKLASLLPDSVKFIQMTAPNGA